MKDLIQRVKRPILVDNILFYDNEECIKYLRGRQNVRITIISTDHLKLFEEDPFLKDWAEGGFNV